MLVPSSSAGFKECFFKDINHIIFLLPPHWGPRLVALFGFLCLCIHGILMIKARTHKFCFNRRNCILTPDDPEAISGFFSFLYILGSSIDNLCVIATRKVLWIIDELTNLATHAWNLQAEKKN